MVVESTEIQFKTSSRDKLTGELIGGILAEEFSQIAAHLTIGCLEATRIFPGVSCQIFSVEIDGSGFPNDKAVEDSNRLAHDIMYLFNRKGLVIVPTAFILQKAGRFIRRKLLTTDFEKPRSDCVFATQSFNDERLPVEPESKMRIPVIRLP